MTYILGISTNHNATAALLKDGELVSCASEERFTRTKNYRGVPKHAIHYCLKKANISPQDLNCVTLADLLAINPAPRPQSRNAPSFSSLMMDSFALAEDKLEMRFPKLRPLFYWLATLPTGSRRIQSQEQRLKALRKILPLAQEKFTFIDHHTCHAAAALFSSPFISQKKDVLVFTSDGAGDLKSATITIYKNGKLRQLQAIDSQQSLGFFYLHITQFLGMKPMEDEYKVMGLAAYAKDPKRILSAYKKLSHLFEFDEKKGAWKIKINGYLIPRKLPKLLAYTRFDDIAAATQKITEKLLVKWVRVNVARHKVRVIACSGGVFANIKVNQKIAQLPTVREAYFMPSPGDESNALGAALHVHWQDMKHTPTFPKAQPLSYLYLGPSYSDRQIQKAITTHKNAQYTVKRVKNLNAAVARLLAKGEIVARFSGRMEFGARALGNRSILAHPRHREVVEVINKAIKNRDFWMPFAPTILRSSASDYLILHKADSPFMNVAYDTTAKAKQDLKAAIHPYDKTTRPQILDRETNPQYWDVIKKFENLTGIGAVLNTSFNLHGEPIVMSPEDALRVFTKSSLKYLAIGNLLLKKTD